MIADAQDYKLAVFLCILCIHVNNPFKRYAGLQNAGLLKPNPVNPAHHPCKSGGWPPTASALVSPTPPQGRSDWRYKPVTSSCPFVDNSFLLRALRGWPPASATSPHLKSRAESVRLCCMIGKVRVQSDGGTVSGWRRAPLFSRIPSLFPSANRGQSWPGSIAGK